MRIQHNIMAMNAYRNLGMNNKGLSKNLEKLSSGYRINRAGDDAAGLAISEKMRSQIAGLDQAQKNAQSGINLVQTAEGALTEVHDMLNRMVTLSTQAANGTYTETDREKIQSEIDALTEEIDRIAENSNFNGKKLLDGTLGSGTIAYDAGSSSIQAGVGGAAGAMLVNDVKGQLKEGTYTFATTTNPGEVTVTFEDGLGNAEVSTYDLSGVAFAGEAGNTNSLKIGDITIELTNLEGQTGLDIDAALAEINGQTIVGTATGTPAATAGLQLQIGSSTEETIFVAIDSMSAESLGVNALSVANEGDANASINKINDAIEKVSVQRSNLGAVQNRLEHTINNLGVMEENIQDAEATIRDTDIADEMMAYTKNNILIQSAQAMLAQANQVPQGVLQLMQ